jgi:hypothetical protein
MSIADYQMKEVKQDGKLKAGTPMINWEFNIVCNAKTGDETYANRKVWMNIPIHERTLFNLKAMLRASGKYTDEELVGTIEFEPEDILGAQVIGVITQREYNGDTVNDVKRVLPLFGEDEATGASLLP